MPPLRFLVSRLCRIRAAIPRNRPFSYPLYINELLMFFGTISDEDFRFGRTARAIPAMSLM